MKIILASQSPRRKEILEEIGYQFEVIPSYTQEYFDPSLPLEKAIQQVAYQKAADVHMKYPDDLVIGADTIVSFQNKIYGKPKDEQEAFSFLRDFSGKYQEVMTGICFLYKERELCHTDITKVWFRDLSDEEIWDYIHTHNALDKAGAYGIQDSDFISHIDGSLSNVVGLGKESIVEMMKKISDWQ